MVGSRDELHRQEAVVCRIEALRERLFAIYGEMPGDVELIREHREQ
jgi:hypothetical protein